MINENNITSFINKIYDLNISVEMWNDGIQDSFIASFYWTFLWIILTAIISYIYYKYTNKIFNYKFIKLRKKFATYDDLDGIYKSDYSYIWSIKESLFTEERKEYLNILIQYNSNSNSNSEIENIIKFMSKDTKNNNINCWKIVKNFNHDENTKLIFKTLYKIEKLYSRKLIKENLRIEVIEIIFIKNKIYGFTLPNICENFKKVRHGSENQDEPIELKEQNIEFRFFGEKQPSSNLYIGFWQDPDKNKRYYGSFTFVYPTIGTELKGKWLGEDKKSEKDINSGSWKLTKRFKNFAEYTEKRDTICQ